MTFVLAVIILVCLLAVTFYNGPSGIVTIYTNTASKTESRHQRVSMLGSTKIKHDNTDYFFPGDLIPNLPWKKPVIDAEGSQEEAERVYFGYVSE